MAIAFDSKSQFGTNSGTGPWTWTHTFANGSGNDRAMILVGATKNLTALGAPTVAGVTMNSLVGTNTDNGFAKAIYYLTDSDLPSTAGATNCVFPDLAAGTTHIAVCSVYTGVDQTTPFAALTNERSTAQNNAPATPRTNWYKGATNITDWVVSTVAFQCKTNSTNHHFTNAEFGTNTLLEREVRYQQNSQSGIWAGVADGSGYAGYNVHWTMTNSPAGTTGFHVFGAYMITAGGAPATNTVEFSGIG